MSGLDYQSVDLERIEVTPTHLFSSSSQLHTLCIQLWNVQVANIPRVQPMNVVMGLVNSLIT